MDESVLAAYLALRHCDALPDQQFARLVRQYQTIAGLLAAPEFEKLASFVAAPDDRCRRKIAEDLHWAAQPQQHLLVFESSQYPALLREIECPPPVIWVRGRLQLGIPQIALVGSRNCSPYGRRTAYWLAGELAALGLTVTSGLARGIDSASHEGALRVLPEDGGALQDEQVATIAVVAHGLDTIYPRQNDALASQIAEYGAVISEFALGIRPLAGHFPRRNRIISGMSQGVVVVEAAMKSGSLITARLAMEQNREVFAVPGPINTASSEGSHWLIKNGAKLIDGTADILTELNASTLSLLRTEGRKATHSQAASNRVTDPHCQHLLTLIGGEALLFEELKERSKLHTEQLTSRLLQLEILGQIEIHAGRIHPV